MRELACKVLLSPVTGASERAADIAISQLEGERLPKSGAQCARELVGLAMG